MSDLMDFFDFVEFVDYARRFRPVGLRRYLRDYSDPFTRYSVEEFHARYKFTPETVKNLILPLVEPNLRKSTRRGLSFAPEIKLLVMLRYMATGRFQKMDGEEFNICQQTVSRIIPEVSTLIASKMKYFVKFPSTNEEMDKVKEKFYKIDNFPEVLGCIGCTHIKIKNPGGTSSETFRNKKGWFSIHVQAVTGPSYEFLDIVARWPGSTHKDFIYNNSTIKKRLESDECQGVILGDSEYTVSNVLLTPFLSPKSAPQENYNRSLIKTRQTMEKCLGIWKRRFPCLEVGMGIKLDTVMAIICACATLHNIAILVDELVLLNSEDIDIDDF